MSLLLILALPACINVVVGDSSSNGELDELDETGDGDGATDSTDTDTGSETGDGDGDGDGDIECGPLDCDAEGRCWDWQAGWESEAQSIAPADIDAAVEAGLLTPTDKPTCWAYADGAHSCVEWVEPCSLLIGRPLEEIAVVGGDECEVDYQGPWSWTIAVVVGGEDACFGVFESNVAVRLRPL